MEYISQIITTTLESFDFGFCAAVNILTYSIIKIIDELNKEKSVGTWTKRIVLIISTIIIGLIYFVLGADNKLLINSAILAPVFWSWIAKPICTKLKIDYKSTDDSIEN